MPYARIEVRRVWPPEQVQRIMEAVYLAQREALKVPEDDRQIRYVELPAERFQVPATRSENFTLIEITLFAGRSLAAKRVLYQAIVKHLGALGIQPNDITIILHEVPLENWGICGGVPASDVNLGFKIDV